MKTLECIDPAVGGRLLDDMRVSAASLGREQVRHMEACEHCQEGIERLRRLSQIWETMGPSTAELDAARSKFLATRRGRTHRVTAARGAIAVAVIFAAAAASAAVRIGVARFSSGAQIKVSPVPSPPARLHPQPMAGSATNFIPVVPFDQLPRGTLLPVDGKLSTNVPSDHASNQLVPVPLSPATPSAVVVESLPIAQPVPSRVGGTSTLEPTHRSTDAIGDRQTGQARDAVLVPEASSLATAADVSRREWLAAASAMRAGDYERADRAFGTLARSSDPHTRDAARLARAQLWMAQGRAEDARRELDELSRTGATPQLREAAAGALNGGGNSSPDHTS